MTENKEFIEFFHLNKNKLPLYFKDFKEYNFKKEINENLVIEKVFESKVLQTKTCKVEKFYKPICRFD
jgi:hypothetical protein